MIYLIVLLFFTPFILLAEPPYAGGSPSPETGAAASVPSSAVCMPLLVSDSLEAYLTTHEARAIQSVVDQLQRDLVVVGSAAKGKRRNRETAFPIGKGLNKKSDIDYLVPLSYDIGWFRSEVLQSLERQLEARPEAPTKNLPDLDHPLLIGEPQPERERIWFRPHTEPVLLTAGQANLEIKAWSLEIFTDQELKFEIDRIEQYFMPTPFLSRPEDHDVLTTLGWLRSERARGT